MKRLIFWMMTLLMIFTALTTGAMAYGHSQPASDPLLAMGIQDCAGHKCYNGLVPDVTRWDAVTRRYSPDGNETLTTLTIGAVPYQIYVAADTADTGPDRRLNQILIYSR